MVAAMTLYGRPSVRPLVDRRRQTLADKLSNAIVLRTNDERSHQDHPDPADRQTRAVNEDRRAVSFRFCWRAGDRPTRHIEVVRHRAAAP